MYILINFFNNLQIKYVQIKKSRIIQNYRPNKYLKKYIFNEITKFSVKIIILQFNAKKSL